MGRGEKRDLWVDLQYGNPGAPTLTARVAENAEDIMNGGGEPQLMITDRKLYVDGTFPEYARVFPRLPQGQPEDAPSPWKGLFSPQARYIQRMADLAKTLGGPGTAVMFGTPDPSGPTLVSIPDYPNVRCLIMPARIGAEHAPFVPEWILPVAPAEDSQETVTEKAKQAA